MLRCRSVVSLAKKLDPSATRAIRATRAAVLAGFGNLAFFCVFFFCLPTSFAVAQALPQFAAKLEPFLTLRAGSSVRADVEKRLGTPTRQIKPEVFEYPPPSDGASTAMGIQSIQVEYLSDAQVGTNVVVRMDAWLAAPMAIDSLRARFGQPVFQQNRKDGLREELYFPQLMGAIASADQPDFALAISYLAPISLANVFCDLSSQAMREKRYGDAKEPADNAVVVDPNYARGFLAQGIFYYFAENIEEAMVRFVAASHAQYSARKVAHAHVWMATVYWKKKKQLELARAEYQKALAIAPDFDTVHLEYGRFLKSQKEFDAALSAFTKANELGQAPNEARMELAIFWVNQKAAKKSLPYLVQLAAWADGGGKSVTSILSADYIYAFYAYAQAQARGERNPLFGGSDEETLAVIANYEKAVRLASKLVWVYAELGDEYVASSEWDKAEATYRYGLSLDPKNIGMNQKMAEVLLSLNRIDAALHQAEQALSLAPNEGATMMTMARAYALRHQGQEALAWLRRAGAAGYQAQYRGNLVLEEGIFDEIVNEDELRRLLPGRRER